MDNRYQAALDCLHRANVARAGVCAFSPGLLRANQPSHGIPDGAKSVLVCLFPYFVGIPNKRNVALYAMLPDYHAVAGAMLSHACALLQETFPENRFCSFVDNSPLDEVTAAVRAGLGKRGKNNLLIARDFGSLLFVGEVVTDLALPAEAQDRCCENCGLCVAACPTGALSPQGFDRSRCRSHLTQKKNGLTDWEASEISAGLLVWGCDLCALACPHNRAVPLTPYADFLGDVVPVVGPDNLDLLLKNRAFSWRGRHTVERNLRLTGG